MLTQIANWIGKFLQSRVVITHPEAPEDTRVLNLFRNRAELKKELGDSQDEVHRLKDRVKLQEGATVRVREQLELLESRLAAPMTGLHALLHYQLRDLWACGHAQIAALLREMAQLREDRERRQYLADVNRQLFERQQSARAACAQAEHVAADVRAKLSAIQSAQAAARSWWQYFRRRDLQRRHAVMQLEVQNADQLLQQTREELLLVEEQGGAKYPGLSQQSRRVLNLIAIACAQVLALRLVPPALLSQAAGAMARSEPKIDGVQDVPACLALMQDIGRAKAAMAQNLAAINADVRRLTDALAAGVAYRNSSDTTPTVESTQTTLLANLSRPDAMTWNVMEQDLWSVSDLFYAEGD